MLFPSPIYSPFELNSYTYPTIPILWPTSQDQNALCLELGL